jgi:hypothetical protein
MNRLTQLKTTTPLFLIVLALACFALAAQARAACQHDCLADQNTVLGQDALFSLTPSFSNTAIGFEALYSNTSPANTAIGSQAMFNNTVGAQNTAIGASALQANINGVINTATGVGSLASNTEGAYNTANGGFALTANTTGAQNTAVGTDAMVFNDSGSANTATGFNSLESNTTGNRNTAIGFKALFRNVRANNNIALGVNAGSELTSGGHNIHIGNAGVADDSHTIRIGTEGTQSNTFIAGISGVTVAGGVGVIIDTTGHLGTVVSSERFKENVQPMDKASEVILALKPVTFRYKKKLDPKDIPQFGLVAEDVEKVDPALVACDKQGKPFTVRYEAVNAMLLNEFLKEHRKVETLEATVAQQRKDFEAAIAQLTAQVQKVTAQLELNKSAPQTAVSNL